MFTVSGQWRNGVDKTTQTTRLPLPGHKRMEGSSFRFVQHPTKGTAKETE
jgi:hypothetical protein